MSVTNNRFSIAIVMAFMILAPNIVLGLAPADPFFFVDIKSEIGEAEVGGTITFEVGALSQEGYEGNVQLELSGAPAGVTAIFDPNPVFVPGFDEGFSLATIEVASTVSEGDFELTVTGKDVAGVAREGKTTFTLTVSGVAASGPPPGSSAPASSAPASSGPAPSEDLPPGQTVTTTVTSTVTVSTIVTTPTTVVSTVTQIITTKTSSISSKTSLEEFNQANDILYPIVTLAGIVVIVGAVIALRRSKN